MEQHMEALAKANATKQIAKPIQQGLTSGELPLEAALMEPALQRYRLGKVLGWLPRMVPVFMHKLLAEAEMVPWAVERPIGRLTDRQRRALIEADERRRLGMQERSQSARSSS